MGRREVRKDIVLVGLGCGRCGVGRMAMGWVGRWVVEQSDMLDGISVRREVATD